jgi:hypothetical protein
MFFFLFIWERKNEQAHENINIHYQCHYGKGYIVAYLKKQIEKTIRSKNNNKHKIKYNERGDDTYLLYSIFQINSFVLNLYTYWCSQYLCDYCKKIVKISNRKEKEKYYI